MTDPDIIGMLGEQLARLDRGEAAALAVGFLRTRKKVGREFVRYCASHCGNQRRQHPGWGALLDALERVESEERSAAERERRDAFMDELEGFREDCLAGRCTECADFEDKRRAYADGDYYFEDFVHGFIDDHGSIQAFIRYAKEADRYFRRGDHATAGRAYGILLEIYCRDTDGEHLFVEDDDFPDLDLSQVDGVDAGRLEGRYEACRRAMSPGIPSHEGSGKRSEG